MDPNMLKMYIAVLDEVPSFMVPTLVAHSVLSAHMRFYSPHGESLNQYNNWFYNSYKKVVLKVNRKEFDKIKVLDDVHLGHENTTLGGIPTCIVVCPRAEYPNVLKFAKTWEP